MTTIPNETKRANAAKAIVDGLAKLDRAIETFLESSIALGREKALNAHGAPLSGARLLRDVQSAVLIGLPAARLPGARQRLSEARFARGGLRIGAHEIVRRGE
jgi:hypothetical protein